MERAQFDHVIAAAAEIAREEEIVVIGSQAVHGLTAGGGLGLDGGRRLSPPLA